MSHFVLDYCYYVINPQRMFVIINILTHRSGDGEVVLLFVTLAGFTLLAGDLGLEFLLLVSCCLAALI